MERLDPCIANGPESETDDILKIAGRAALVSGKIIKELYGKPHQIRHKGAIDLVTEADVASEKAILEIITKAFPDHTILAEESKAAYSDIPHGPTWIIDPLDGTTNFAHSFPFFGVSIGYTLGKELQAGLIFCPIQNELFCSIKGKGAWLNGTQVYVTPEKKLQNSLVGTGFPYDVLGTLEQVTQAMRNVLPQVQDLRRAGAAAIDLAYVACGRLDGFWEMNLKPWDSAAGALLVSEAGGRLSTFSGKPFSPFFPEIIASNSHIHSQLVELLS
nr:inositol monophosphatase [Desulfobulbaceae bacterium]